MARKENNTAGYGPYAASDFHESDPDRLASCSSAHGDSSTPRTLQTLCEELVMQAPVQVETVLSRYQVAELIGSERMSAKYRAFIVSTFGLLRESAEAEVLQEVLGADLYDSLLRQDDEHQAQKLKLSKMKGRIVERQPAESAPAQPSTATSADGLPSVRPGTLSQERQHQGSGESGEVESGGESDGVALYPYSALKAGVQWPAGVHPDARELHLSNSDFRLVLGMDRDAFAKIPAWKKVQLKQAALLF